MMIHLTSAERQVLDANIMARLRDVVSPASYPRPLGVREGPHVGDVVAAACCEDCGSTPDARGACRACDERDAALDLSHEATPAADDLRNLMFIMQPCQDSMLREAVMRLAKSALAKIEAGA